jgi:hypothetical protein
VHIVRYTFVVGYVVIHPFVGPWPLFQFQNRVLVQSVGLLERGISPPVARPLHRHRATQTQNKHTQTSMHRVGFEPTTPVYERVTTIYALGHVATVINGRLYSAIK